MPFVGSIGPLELLVVLGVILLIFGPKRLPAAGRALGQGIREFKHSITGGKKGAESEDEEPAELPAGRAGVSAPPAPEGAGAAPGSREGAGAAPGSRESAAPGSPEGDPVARE